LASTIALSPERKTVARKYNFKLFVDPPTSPNQSAASIGILWWHVIPSRGIFGRALTGMCSQTIKSISLGDECFKNILKIAI
jgi:hypothetical protein